MDRYVRWPELKVIVGFSRCHLYTLESKGQFPKRRKIGPKSVAWLESEIKAWVESREVA